MIHLGDITKMTVRNTPPADCITFGSPCQDLSIAGKRAGLGGERSGLFMDAIRVIKTMYLDTLGQFPKFAVWENVPGAFSSNKGEDFRVVLEELARIKEPEVSIPRPENGKWAKAGFICGNGWSIAWRTFDAQHWGVPQRRRRIALVLDLTGQRAGEILFERTGVSGNPEPSIPPWKGIARDPAHSAAGHDRVVEEPESYTLKIRSGCAGGGKGPLVQTEKSATLSTSQDQTLFVCTAYPDTARALTARYDGSPCADRGPNVVCLQGNMIDRDVQQNGSGVSESETMFTLNATDRHGVCVSYVFEAHSQDARYTQQGNTSPACTAQWGTGGNNMPIVASTQNQRDEVRDLKDIAAALAAEPGMKQQTYIAETLDCRNARVNHEISGTLQAKPGGGFSYNCINPVAVKIWRWIVRRLTPTECERLQGYPDGWTDIGDWVDSKGKRHKAADSPRYKALGNSIALPQWWWITCKMAQYLPEHATLGSLFDGIGGFPLVWETLHGKGTAVWASEIEEFPIAVTKARFPE